MTNVGIWSPFWGS